MNCKKCGFSNWIKKGFNANGKQRWLCKNCGYRTIMRDRNVLVIGDLHEPFCLDEYLKFNEILYNKYNVTDVVFIGDIIDNHYTSFHDADPDGMGGGDELECAVKRLKRWYEAFPEATVILGNHDLRILRKLFTAGVPKRWIKEFSEVLECPNWKFVPELYIDGVLYRHGVGTKSSTKSGKDLISVVQGHWHSEAYVIWKVGRNCKIFGMQVGCGIDVSSYAMGYAKSFPKPVISSGLVLENGKLPLIELMEIC